MKNKNIFRDSLQTGKIENISDNDVVFPYEGYIVSVTANGKTSKLVKPIKISRRNRMIKVLITL